MSCWIFKLAKQELYPDVLGEKYVFDNTHSIRVRSGDTFLYLEKKSYSITGMGRVKRLSERKPTKKDLERRDRIRTVFIAHLADVVWLSEPLSFSPSTKIGRSNRAKLGVENLLAWGTSIISIGEPMFERINELAKFPVPEATGGREDYSVPDNWGKSKTRGKMEQFKKPVRERSDNACVVCGSSLSGLIEAAHLSSYASDVKNRANPANGVCLCKYCHGALDERYIALQPDGQLLISPKIDDEVALSHFNRVSVEQRRMWLNGVGPDFLNLTVEMYRDCWPDPSEEVT